MRASIRCSQCRSGTQTKIKDLPSSVELMLHREMLALSFVDYPSPISRIIHFRMHSEWFHWFVISMGSLSASKALADSQRCARPRQSSRTSMAKTVEYVDVMQRWPSPNYRNVSNARDSCWCLSKQRMNQFEIFCTETDDNCYQNVNSHNENGNVIWRITCGSNVIKWSTSAEPANRKPSSTISLTVLICSRWTGNL